MQSMRLNNLPTVRSTSSDSSSQNAYIGRAKSVEPNRYSQETSVNARILTKIARGGVDKRQDTALKFTRPLLPKLSSMDKFISIVPEKQQSHSQERTKQYDAFLKQKGAHNKNMKDFMYQVHFRDANFMSVQNQVVTESGKKSNADAHGIFEYEKHAAILKNLNKGQIGDYTSRKVKHILPTRQDREAYERKAEKK